MAEAPALIKTSRWRSKLAEFDTEVMALISLAILFVFSAYLWLSVYQSLLSPAGDPHFPRWHGECRPPKHGAGRTAQGHPPAFTPPHSVSTH